MKRGIKIFIFGVFLFVFWSAAPPVAAQGHFEIGFHYSGWSLNVIKNLVEDMIEDLSEEFVNSAEESIQEENPDYYVDNWDSSSEFNANGSNWGVEARWYPKGRDGSFSLGFSVEQTSMNFALDRASILVNMRNDVEDLSGTADINASGGLAVKPTAMMLSLRWNIAASGRISPYFQMGFGFASVNALRKAELDYAYDYTFKVPNEPDETGGDSDRKTLEDIDNEREEGEDSLFDEIPFLPFFNLSLGLRARLMDNLHVLAEGGFFNGLILRGGLSLRF
jgi:hypothetical protein